MSRATPPRVAAALLEAVLSRSEREHVLGDLHEEYASLVVRRGRGAATRWYWVEVWRALGPSLVRRVASLPWRLEDVWLEVRQVVRALLRRPGLTFSSIATLALGIGLTTAIFSVVHTVLLKPLPYPGGDRLVQLWNTYNSWRGHEILGAFWDRIELSYPEYRDWRDQQSSLEEAGIYSTLPAPLTGDWEPDEVLVGAASVTLFPLLGVAPRVGRLFGPEEEGPGAPRVAILSHAEWRGRFGSDVQVVGRTLEVRGVPFTVIGVLPAGFQLRPMSFPGAEPHAVWVPIGALGEDLDRGNHRYEALGRLLPDVTLERAQLDAERILSAELRPGSRGARMQFRHEAEVGNARAPLLLLLGAVSLLMLIACGNVAMLLLGETTRRSREFATRSAIGAGRYRIVRQLMMESALVGTMGAVGGVLVAEGSTRVILRLAPERLPVHTSVSLDPRILGFAIALGLTTGLLFGLAPVAAAWRRNVQRDLRSRADEGVRGRAFQRTVLIGQVGLSLVLLAGGGLLARTVAEVGSVSPGFDPANLLTARISMSDADYSRDEATKAYMEMVGSLSGVAGVESATLASALPFSGRGGSSSFQIVGREVPPAAKQPEANRRTVLPNFHETMGIPLVAGRYFSAADRIEAAPVVLVNVSMAQRYWPSGDAIGKRISRDRREFEIVGIVGDVLHTDLTSAPQPTFYVPFEVAEQRHEMMMVVRSQLSDHSVRDLIRAVVRETAADVPVEEIMTASALIGRSMQEERFRFVLLTVFALSATGLSAVGLFGVTTRLVAARRREMGIRVALGAHRSLLVRRLVLMEGAVLAAGIALGLAGALLAGRALAGFLFGVAPVDPVSIGGATLLLSVTGLGACWIAARRGTAVDPVEAIRSD